MLIVCFILGFSLFGIRVFANNLRQAAAQAVMLSPKPVVMESLPNLPKVSVIIPAYNEADNIESCLISVLESTVLGADQLEVWVVDDQSTDETLAIVNLLQASRLDPRLKILPGKPRPTGEAWVGKNWACAQVVEQTQGEFLLFLDADVRLKPGCIETAVAFAQKEQIDLLTFWMTIVCGCLAEWLVQPIIASLLAAGYPFAEVNNPKSETVFAVGPFMLFRRSAYEQIGGHRAVANCVVEDVKLGHRIKQHGLKLWYGLGHELAEVRMYRSFSALWEGWTKNWHLGSNRNLQSTFYAGFVTFLVFVVPWLGLGFSLFSLMSFSFDVWNLGAIVLASIAIFLQYNLRQNSQHLSNIPPRYWWLSGLGGFLVTSIAIASIIKTETGWGWTWRGRSLRREIGSRQ